MICPDLSVGDFDILGEPSSMIAHKLVFQIQKCEDSNRKLGDPKCAEPDEIERFIRKKGIISETWVIQQKINWGLY